MPQTSYAVIDEHKQSALDWRQRRHPEWTENMMFYRDRVWYDRLTQRQSVNVPLMKYSIKTLLKDIDEPPALHFTNKSNNFQKEIYINEQWKQDATDNILVVKDIVDKKQVFLFGRTFKKLNIYNGRIYWEVVLPNDILVSRYVDPTNMETARFVSHINIFRPLSSIQMNTMYSPAVINKLTKFYKETKEGQQQAAANALEMEATVDAAVQLGDFSAQAPILGETYVQLSENYLTQYDKVLGMDQIYFSVSCPDIAENLTENDIPQDEIIGKARQDYWKNHLVIDSWADDPDRSDFWTDGVADTLRTPNKILNSIVSQMIENRTLRNFGMTFYDSTVVKDGSFIPQTYTAEPFGMYPFPGDPNKVTKRVDIPDLSDSFNMVNFISGLADKASGASATSQGQIEKTKVTLGEIQLALANSKDRARGMSPLYTRSWETFGEKYAMMLEAGAEKGILDAVTIYKKGRENKRIWERDIKPSDYQDEAGYMIEVRDLNQNRDKVIEQIQTMQAAKNAMPQNKPLDMIYKRKLLELNELPSAEIQEVIEYEKKLLAAPPTPATVVDPKTGKPMMNGGQQPPMIGA